VKRDAFVAGTLACLAPRAASAETLYAAVERIAQTASGITGVYARRLGGSVADVSYNSEEQFPAASTIKLLILVTAFQLAENDAGLMDRIVRLRAGDMVGGSDMLQNAAPGSPYSVRQLVRAMIVKSDNTASNALITTFGFERINATARRANLKHTQLKRHFLDYTAIVRHSENLTTPHDIGALMYQIERGAHEGISTLASSVSCREMIDIMLHQEDRDKIPRALPKGTPIANKTGEVDFVRNDVAIVDPYGDAPYVLSVLTKGLQNYGDGLTAIRKIAKTVHASLTRS